MSAPEIYVSTDVETDGPVPGLYSMLSFGSAAFALDNHGHEQQLSTFAANLEVLPGAQQHPDTMAWWVKQPDAWQACRRDLQPPEQALPAYAAWLNTLPGVPVFVAFPAGFDFTFIYWYLHRFTGASPFSFAALDIKTLAMAALGTNFRHTTKRAMPKRWFAATPHTHVALDDAIEQGHLFAAIMRDLRR